MKTNPGNPMDLRENLKNSLKKKKKKHDIQKNKD